VITNEHIIENGSSVIHLPDLNKAPHLLSKTAKLYIKNFSRDFSRNL
jgi:hypothetical protein